MPWGYTPPTPDVMSTPTDPRPCPHCHAEPPRRPWHGVRLLADLARLADFIWDLLS